LWGGVPALLEDKVNNLLVKANDPRELATAISLLRGDNVLRELRKHTKSIVIGTTEAELL
jgi:hypothetical protein